MKFLFYWACFIVLQIPIFPDTVFMRNGKQYENVKTKINQFDIQFQLDNNQLKFTKSLVKSIKLKPVISKPPTNAKEQEEYDKERIRVADALQDSPDFESGEVGKPRLAILNFQPGAGVSLGEAETITNLITERLVKTKLFIVVDKLTIEKITKTCKVGEDCSKLVAEKIGANKILTGIVTKIKNKYYINGTIIDQKNSKIDFAEKTTANSLEEIEPASDLFAKKVAGGILDFWDEPMFAKDKVNSFPFVWRSALLPGFGQYYYGMQTESRFQKGKGIVFGLITIGLIANLANSYASYDQKKETYDFNHKLFLLSANRSNLELISYLKDNENFNQLKDSSNYIATSLGAVAGFYLINIIDSAFLGRTLFSETETKKTSFQFYPTHSLVTSNGIVQLEESIQIDYRFHF
ncbi:MAG: DUF5683 domain-containing protein [Leptospiraceae bacterium]|nr:DUF5683 domain-containing protein [Leptospiraceae bacterium]